jgi:hypothetical protein
VSRGQKDGFEGGHDGYLRLEDPVRHRRLVELDKAARRVLVEDTLEMARSHEVELFFHCHEACRLEPIEQGFILWRGEACVRLLLPQAEGASVAVRTGSLVPMAGWISRAFDSRIPAPTIVWRARLAGRTVLRSEMHIPRAVC